ncbi:MAG: DUF1415 domain-containing protein [Bacteroidota bacterium]
MEDLTVYEERTKLWVENIVIGLNFCPFAAKPFKSDLIEYQVSEAITARKLFEDFLQCLQRLVDLDPQDIATSLLIHPFVLLKLEAYLDFFAEAEALLEESGADQVVQIAGFHPVYIFDGIPIDHISNYTNRSPYPMIHLIRAEQVELARHTYPGIEQIPAKNIELLEAMGWEKFRVLFNSI